MIEVEAPDGSIVEFPDGTPDDVMSRAMQSSFGGGQSTTSRRVELPHERNPVGMAEGVIGSMFQGVTFGAGDEIAAGLRAAVNPSNASEVYDEQLARTRNRNARFRDQAPAVSTAAEIAGALPTALMPLGVLGKAAQAGSVPARAVAGGAIGAGQGATYAFNAGEDGFENRVGDALTGAAVGGGVGAVAPALGAGVRAVRRGVTGARASQSNIANAPSVEQLRSQATKLFDASSKDGLAVKPAAFQSAVADIAAWAADQGIDPTLHPGATAALKRLTQAADDPNQTASIETLRRVLGSAAGSRAPDEGRIASGMIDRLDGFMDSLTPDQIASGNPASLALLKQGREAWGRMRRSELVDDAVTRAERRAASTGSGGNVNNAIRQNIKSILDSPAKRRGFSDTEIAAMEDVVRGRPTENALRLLGKLSPQSGALPLIMNLGAAGASGGFSLPLTAAATGAKALADFGTRNSTRTAQALVAHGGRVPAIPPNPRSGLLVELLAQRNAAATGPAR